MTIVAVWPSVIPPDFKTEWIASMRWLQDNGLRTETFAHNSPPPPTLTA